MPINTTKAQNLSNLVLFASADADSRSNYLRTVETGVDLSILGKHLSPQQTGLLRAHFGQRSIPVWGVWPGMDGRQQTKWERVNDGDLAVFSRTNGVRAHARVVLTFRSPSLASVLWKDKQTTSGPRPYELMFALDEVTAIDLGYTTLNPVLGYSSSASIRGLNVLDEEQSSAAQSLLTGVPRSVLSRPHPLRIDVEASNAAAYPVRAGSSTNHSAVRRESALVTAYVAWLKTRGHAVCRHRVPLPEGGNLYTDVFDVDSGEVLEAKSDSTRLSIRTALGQVLDYDHLIPETRSRAVLTPDRPRDDLIALLRAYGVAAVWQQGSRFLRLDP